MSAGIKADSNHSGSLIILTMIWQPQRPCWPQKEFELRHLLPHQEENMKELHPVHTGLEEPESETHHLLHDKRAPGMFTPVTSVPIEDTCPICNGTGFLRSTVESTHPLVGQAQPCYGPVRAQKYNLFTGANLPPRYKHCTFSSYLTLPLDPTQRQTAAQVETFVMLRLQETSQGDKHGLYLYGPWGTGKTGLAIAAMHTVVAARQPALYVPTFQLFQMVRESLAASQRIREGYADDEDLKDESRSSKQLQLVRTIPWLILDDLGVECGSPWVISQLYAILETRRLMELFTILTSNNDMQTLQEQWYSEGRHRSDDAVRCIERIGEYCVPVYLSGRNLREK
jgi:DNA replication protein DnaC